MTAGASGASAERTKATRSNGRAAPRINKDEIHGFRAFGAKPQIARILLAYRHRHDLLGPFLAGGRRSGHR